MTPYENRPWLASYAAGHPASITPDFTDALSMFRAALARAPQASALLYFDGTLTYAELDEQSSALASAWRDRGCGRGERIAICLQNVPQFVIALLAAWKLGAIAVPVNPMNRARELRLILTDSGARTLVCHESLYAEVVQPMLAQEAAARGGRVGRVAEPVAEPALAQLAVLVTSAREYQHRDDARLFGSAEDRARRAGCTDGTGRADSTGRADPGCPDCAGHTSPVPSVPPARHTQYAQPEPDAAASNISSNAEDWRAVLAAGQGRVPPAFTPGPDDLAMLVYTSGTTGVPKGAMNTHGNVAFNSQVYRDWIGLREGGPILGVAPLFHITGLIGHIGAAFICAAPLILAYRFEPGVILDAIREHRAEFVIGSITVFIALMNHPDATREHFASLGRIYSGGAPIPPSVIDAFRARFGRYIHNGYGLTETNSPTHIVPLGRAAPVDPVSGTLAIGVPTFNVDSFICDDQGRALPPGEVGEIVSRGPMIVPGYWNKPQESAQAFVEGYFHTGDVGFMDEAGWFYLVDRKKDMINASGYKVWPREVEDVLYTHPAVREAAVVGVPDSYRGETVKAVVSLKPGARATPEELVQYCKERMAAYKYPRVVEILDELPKTMTGKILRRELKG